MKLFCALFALFLASADSYAQHGIRYFQNDNAQQSGLRIKMQLEFGAQRDNVINWRLVLSAGAGAFLIEDLLYPSLQGDFMFFHSGLGSGWPGVRKRSYLDAQFILGYTLTTGCDVRLRNSNRQDVDNVSIPLYYFNTYSIPTVQNPFNYSVSWGGNAIFLLSRKHDKFQQVGFLNLHVDRFQISYGNDGPPFSAPFGDKHDRFHTGHGFFSFHGNKNWGADLFEIGFSKFTGYGKNTYEVSNKLGLTYNYYNESEQMYNKSLAYLNVASNNDHWTSSFNIYNATGLDVQHKIHRNLFYPLHMVPYKYHVAVSAGYFYNSSKIGLK